MHVQIQRVRRQRFAHADILSMLGETLCLDVSLRTSTTSSPGGEARGAVTVAAPTCAIEPRCSRWEDEDPERWDGLE